VLPVAAEAVQVRMVGASLLPSLAAILLQKVGGVEK
jgi:hypothetical protein